MTRVMRLQVAPTERLFMDPLQIMLLGAPPGAEIALEATLTDHGGQAWSSRGVYFADSSGTVDPSRSASLAGTYRGVDGDALFWSMQPATLSELDAAGSRANEIDSRRRYPDFDAFDARSEMRLEPVHVEIRARVAGDLAEKHPAVLEEMQTVRLIDRRVKRTLVSEDELRDRARPAWRTCSNSSTPCRNRSGAIRSSTHASRGSRAPTA
jgi:hypothetical protein